MKHLKADKKDARKRDLLKVVVEEYIRTGRPVGSLTLSEDQSSTLSAPSIRNIFAELEREGFLTHPHTSAGRVPTDKGYRFYVDTLDRFWSADQIEAGILKQELETRSDDMEEFLRSVPWALGRMSGWLGFIITPPMQESDLDKVEVVPVGYSRAMVVFVGGSGLIRHRTVFFNETTSKKDIVRRAIEGTKEKRIYIGGEDSVYGAPDFSPQEIGSFLHLFSHRGALIELLEEDLRKELDRGPRSSVIVKIGSENKPEVFKNLSVVAAPYGKEGGPKGVLGILGARRMNYSRVVGVVGFMGYLVNEILTYWNSRSTFPGFELTRK